MKENYYYGDTILKLENISMQFDDKLIIKDINLEIKDILRPNKVTGQIYALAGKSGIGKSVLFNIIAGLLKPTTGNVFVENNTRNVNVGDIGVVSQFYPLFEHRTIKSNLDLVTVKDKKDEMMFYLEKFKMLDHLNKYPCQLSGGQRQRISIIQQLLCSDYFILMDEPFSGLDPLMVDECCNLIYDISQLNDKNTFIIISHDIRAVLSISDIVWLIGWDYDENGNPLPGSTIKYQENLMDLGFTWRKDINQDPEFNNYVASVRHVVKNL